MNSIRILLLATCLCLSFSLISARKDEKALKDGPTTGLMQYVDLVKYIYNHALNRADPASVRGLFTGPLSFMVYGASLLIGSIVLLAFYESPLSPLPVPPLPHPPVGRFPPEHAVLPKNRLHRASHASPKQPTNHFQYPPINFPHPAQFVHNPTQYQFAGSNLNPTMVEQPVARNTQHVPQPSTNAQRRSSTTGSTAPQNQPRKGASSQPAISNVHFHPINSAQIDQSIDKRSSFPINSGVNPSTSSLSSSSSSSSSATNLDASESINKFVASAAKAPEVNSFNPSLSPVNLLNVVNGNQMLRQDSSSDSSNDFKQQQLVQAQLNQVQFNSSPVLSQLESHLNRS